MMLGALASILAAVWKFVGFSAAGKAGSPLDPMHALAGRVRNARSEAELAQIEEEIDNISRRSWQDMRRAKARPWTRLH
jgi:hypothetical protein